jgi:hypothetical protein
LVNLSIAMKMYSKPPSAFLSGPTWSSPQHANGQVGGCKLIRELVCELAL